LYDFEKFICWHGVFREKNNMKKFFNSLSEGVIIIHEDGRVLFINRTASMVTGVRIQGNGNQEFHGLFKNAGSEFLDLLHHVLVKKKKVSRREIPYYRRKKELRLSITSLKTDELTAWGPVHVILLRDITEVWRLHSKERALLNQLRKNYIYHMESLREIADSVAHEVRNPISSIGGYADLLIKKCEEENHSNVELKKYLTYIKGDADKLDKLVTLVEHYSDISDVSFTKENASSLFRGLLRYARAEAESYGIPIRVPEIKAARYTVYIDRNKIETAFRDIFAKSIHCATPERPFFIDIQFTPYETLALIEFYTDTITRDDIHFIFNPFMLINPRETSFNLSVAQRILILHGGIISMSLHEKGLIRGRVSFPREKRVRR